MPVLVAFIPAIAAAATITGVALAAITIASAVASAALAAQAARKAKNKARDQYNASLVDRTSMIRGTVEGRDVALGRVRKSGQLAYIATSGATKNKLTMVIAIAGHEIDAFEKVFFNDIEVTLDGSNRVTTAPYTTSVQIAGGATVTASAAGTASVTIPANYTPGTVSAVRYVSDTGGVAVSTGEISVVGTTATATNASIQVGTVVTFAWETPVISYWATVRTYLGTSTQTADAATVAALPGVWTSNHRLRGVAYAVVDLLYNDDVYTSGIPTVSFQVRGAKCFDPRTSTTVWTENPALHARYLALSPLAGNLAAAQINDASVIAAANVCDTTAAYVVSRNGSNVNENRAQFRSGYVFRSGTPAKDGLDDLVQAMAGKWLYANNMLTLKAGAYTSPVMTLTDDDFSGAGDVTVQPSAPREEMVNIVTATMLDDTADYKLVDMPAVRADAYITADGSELPLEMQFEAVSYVPQAQYIARLTMRDARQALTMVASFKMRAYPIEVLDTIAMTSSRYGWSAKTFEVLARRWTLDGMIELTLKETAAAIFTLDAQFESVDISPNTNLPTPWVVPVITGLAANSTTGTYDGTPQARVAVSWTASTSEAVRQGGSIEIAYLRHDQAGTIGANDWPSARVSGSATQFVLTGLAEGVAYLIRVRADNGIARSPWSASVIVIVARLTLGYTGLTGRPNSYRVVATGFSATTQPIAAGFYNGETGANIQSAAMYSVVSINRATRAVTAHGYFNLFSGPPADRTNLVALLNSFNSDRIVVVYTQDEPRGNRFAGGVYEAMLRHGASQGVWGSPQFVSRGAYILIGIGNCGEGNGFESYQGSTTNDPNAWCDVAFEVSAAGNLMVTGQGATPRTLADYSYTGSLNATADLSLIASAGVALSGNSAVRIAATAAGTPVYDQQVYSRDGYTGGAFASAIATGFGIYRLIFGLNTDPTTDADYTSIDYGIHPSSSGGLYAFESGGGAILINGSWAATDVLAVTYDGFSVRYLQNGIVRRTVAAPPNLTLFFDSSMAMLDDSLTNIRFGPLSSVYGVQTGQIAAGAATEVYVATVASRAITGAGGSGTSYTATARWTALGTISFVAPVTGECLLYFNGKANFSGTPTISVDKLWCQVNVNVDFNNNNLIEAGEQFVTDLSYAPGTGSLSLVKQISVSRRIAIIFGTTYTWNFYAQFLEGSLTLTDVELRAEIIKR